VGMRAVGKEVEISKDGLTFCGSEGQDPHGRLKGEARADVDHITGVRYMQSSHCIVDLDRSYECGAGPSRPCLEVITLDHVYVSVFVAISANGLDRQQQAEFFTWCMTG